MTNKERIARWAKFAQEMQGYYIYRLFSLSDKEATPGNVAAFNRIIDDYEADFILLSSLANGDLSVLFKEDKIRLAS